MLRHHHSLVGDMVLSSCVGYGILQLVRRSTDGQSVCLDHINISGHPNLVTTLSNKNFIVVATVQSFTGVASTHLFK